MSVVEMLAVNVVRTNRMLIVPAVAGILLFTLVLVMCGAGVAAAYSTYSGPWDCDQCHATTGEGGDWEGFGPHGYYSLTTEKCIVCHTVHDITVESVYLLPAATVSDGCLTCHDGTGGIGVYFSIEARSGTVAGEHSVEVTSTIPGGSNPLDSVLGCGSCHSVHRANTVVDFLRDSGHAGYWDEYVTSDCLLRSDVNTDTIDAFPEYGAEWCASCHDQRHSDSTVVINHPVDSVSTWGYGDVTSTVSVASNRAENGGAGVAVSMGWTNAGYIMYPTAEAGDGRVLARRDPMCQQCHEDARNVEAIFAGDYTGISSTNPVFLTFPHQTTNANMLVENADDLCLNCHPVSELP